MRKLMMLMLSVVIGCLAMTAQNVLDLTDANSPIIKIKGKPIKADKEGGVFCFKTNDRKPIEIKKVIFANNATEAKQTEIFIGDSLLKKWSGVKNYFDDIPFQIKAKNNINIVWGNRLWTLNVKNNADSQGNTGKPMGKEGTGKPTADAKEISKEFKYVWLVALIMLIGGFFIGANRHRLCRWIKSIRSNAKTGKSEEIETQTDSIDKEENTVSSGESIEEQTKGETVAENEDNGSTEAGISVTDDELTIGKRLDGQIATIIKGYEDEFFKEDKDLNSKIERLQEILPKYFKLLNDKKHLAQELTGNEDADTETLLCEVKRIKLDAEKSQKQDSTGQKTINVSDIECYINKNVEIQGIYNSKSVYSASILDRIRILFDKLNQKIKNSIDVKSTNGDDILKAKRYVIEQLKSYGFKDYFGGNTNLKDGLSKIKEKLNKNEKTEETGSGQKESPSDINAFIKEVKTLLPNIPDGVESAEAFAKSINKLLEGHINTEPKDKYISSSVSVGEATITGFLKEIGIPLGDNMEAAISQIKVAFVKAGELDSVCEQYKADNAKELKNAIKEQIYKSIKGILNSNESAKTIIANSHTTEGIVKSLSEAYADTFSESQRMKEECEALISNVKTAYTKDIDGKPLEGKDLNVLFNAYLSAVRGKIEDNEKSVLSLKQDKSEMQGIINANNEKFGNMLNEMKKILISDFNEIQESLQGKFIRPCGQNLEKQCDQNMALLRDATKSILVKLQVVDTISHYEDLYENVQKIVEEDIANERGLTNVLSRFYAYSCLPFMTDCKREYGMCIDHEAMMKAFNALCHLTSQYGLQLIVPNLFADRIADGEYEDCTSKEYGNLENLCPDVASYIREISNSDKQNYITDIVQVGYKKGEEIKQKARVIIAN